MGLDLCNQTLRFGKKNQGRKALKVRKRRREEEEDGFWENQREPREKRGRGEASERRVVKVVRIPQKRTKKKDIGRKSETKKGRRSDTEERGR